MLITIYEDTNDKENILLVLKEQGENAIFNVRKTLEVNELIKYLTDDKKK